MLSRIHTAAAAGIAGARTQAAARNSTRGANDAFSQQLLSILQNGLERLGVPSGGVKVVRAETACETAGARGSSQCQYVVTVPASDVAAGASDGTACATASQAAPKASSETAAGETLPDVLFEQHEGWNWRNYATFEMAQWLAQRLGGEVGTYTADWSPGFEPPPTYYTIRFGNVEMNAGQLAVYYQPGDYVDPDRMAAAGASYGGYMVNWILGHTSRFKALVSHAGAFDLRSKFGETEELWFPLWEFRGAPWDDPQMYERWSPSNSVKEFRTPTLVTHGELDFRVPFGQGLQLFTALQLQKVPSKLILFPDEGHWITQPQNSVFWYRNVIAWLDRWLRTE